MNGQGALDPAGIGSTLIERLWWLFFWPTIGVFGVVVLATTIAFWVGARAAKRHGQAATTQPEPRRERRVDRIVIASSAVSIVILVGLLVASIATGRELSGAVPGKPLQVRITAHQWWWEIVYPSGYGPNIVTTANELHVPVGTDLDFELMAADVIHSFWVPALHGKADMIPSHTTHLRLRVDRPGVYRGHCAEFCGYQHAHMDLTVVAEPRAAFQAWLENERSLAREAAAGSAQDGRRVFEAGACSSCHTIRGTTASGTIGPDLTHFARRRQIGAGASDNNHGALAAWITNAQALKPGTNMPSIQLGTNDLNALLAYLEALK